MSKYKYLEYIYGETNNQKWYTIFYKGHNIGELKYNPVINQYKWIFTTESGDDFITSGMVLIQIGTMLRKLNKKLKEKVEKTVL